MDLDNKVAIITGAGRGIGKDISIALAKENCNVVLVSRTEAQLKDAINEIKKSDVKSKAIYIAADLSLKQDIDKVVQKTLEHFGNIDILINNAAFLSSSSFFDLSEEIWDKTLDINLKSVFLLSQKVMEIMVKNKTGYIINISSTAALQVPPTIAVYGISKKALIGLSEVLYEIGKESNVKVSTIFPGMTDTEMLRSFNPPVEHSKWMLPADITDCVLFLLKQSDRVVVKEIIPWASKHDQI